jgi:hypothetical protein
MYLQTNMLSDFSALEALFPEWEALQAQIIPRTPFNSPAWFEAWWRHYRRRTAFTQDNLFVHTLRDLTRKIHQGENFAATVA